MLLSLVANIHSYLVFSCQTLILGTSQSSVSKASTQHYNSYNNVI
jgi:hypothetical protein